MKFFDGDTWRRLSEAEAKYRIAEGFDVVEDDAPEDGASPPSDPPPASSDVVDRHAAKLQEVREAEVREAEARADAEKASATPTDQPKPEQPAAIAPSTPAPIVDSIEFAESSNVRRALLDAAGVVTVDFANGSTYRYAGFSTAEMNDWRAAKSAGGWFHANVRSRPDRHPVIPASIAGA